MLAFEGRKSILVSTSGVLEKLRVKKRGFGGICSAASWHFGRRDVTFMSGAQLPVLAHTKSSRRYLTCESYAAAEGIGSFDDFP